MKKIMITGGLGCIGLEVTKLLDRSKYNVKIFDLPESRFDGYNSPNTEYFFGSILDRTALLDALKGVEVVIHLAAYLGVERTETNRLRGLDINIFGTQNVIEASLISGVKKIVFASSSEIYGDPVVDNINEDCSDRGKSVYAISKLAGEEYLKAYSKVSDLKATIIRFFNTFGPRQEPQFVVPKFISQVINGKNPTVYGDGKQLRSYCYVTDSASGLIKAMEYENDQKINIFNIGNPSNKITLIDLANLICEIYGNKNIKPEIIGNFNDTDRDENREIFKRVCDISKAESELNYKPKISLLDGIKKIKLDGLPYARWTN